MNTMAWRAYLVTVALAATVALAWNGNYVLATFTLFLAFCIAGG